MTPHKGSRSLSLTPAIKMVCTAWMKKTKSFPSPLLPTAEKHQRDPFPVSCWIKSTLRLLFCFAVVLISFAVFFIHSGVRHLQFSDIQFRGSVPKLVNVERMEKLEAFSAPNGSYSDTNVSHLFFCIAGSSKTWMERRGFSELWWRNGVTRGYVWLDEDPSGGNGLWPKTSPPYRVSRPVDSNRFGDKAPATRIARIVKEAYELLEEAGEGYTKNDTSSIRWLVMGDDDTVFFPDNLATVLGKYSHRQLRYVGGISESVEQDLAHSYGTAFGGAGIAVSLPTAAALSRILDKCLDRYAGFYGSDERIRACLSELGVPLTRELGFHQLDLQGHTFGLLARHPVDAPLLSMHHLGLLQPILPNHTQLHAVGALVTASRADPARTLQQSVCYVPGLRWSVSVSWGYAAEVYPWVLTPEDMATPVRTFTSWRGVDQGPFTFNIKEVGANPCERPIVYFLNDVHADSSGSLTEYVTSPFAKQVSADDCGRANFVRAKAIRTVRVIARRMDPDDWKRAPRRRCCDAKRSWWGDRMDVVIRRCRPDETISPP